MSVLNRPVPEARGMPLVRFAKLLASRSSILELHERAIELFGERDPITLAMHKAAVGAQNGSSSTDGSKLIAIDALNTEFVEAVRPLTAYGRMAARRVPANVRVVVANDGTQTYWVSRNGGAKPLARMSLDAETMRCLILAGVVVITQELAAATTPQAESFARADMLSATAQAVDAAMFDPANSGTTDEQPASIFYGVTPIASSGLLLADLASLVEAYAGDLTKAVFVMDPLTAVQGALAMQLEIDLGIAGGTLAGIPVVTSGGVPRTTAGGMIGIVDASRLLVTEGGINVDRATQATLEFDSAPAQSSVTPTPSATKMINLFQSNLVAIRIERSINWKLYGDATAAYVENVDYGDLLGSTS